jgi:sulfoxide reductase heme-binding subunit YedZ
MTVRKKRFNTAKWLRILVNVGGWIPLVILVIKYFTNNLGFDPIRSALLQTGRYAVLFLLLSLTCTPLRKILKFYAVSVLRKPLGMFAALYAGLHFAIYAIFDFQLNFKRIWQAIIDFPFIILGATALLILAILAATSFKKIQRKMGKKWDLLQRTVYIAAVLDIIHYLLAIKGDLLSLQGNYTWPLIAAISLLILFILRIPWVIHTLKNLIFRKKQTQRR